MQKKNITKINFIKIFFLFSLLKENIFQNSENELNNSPILVIQARKFGYDLTNSNDDFFNNICELFYNNKKDVTLDYRRKYFFYPKNNKTNIKFPNPTLNNTNLCFYSFFNIDFFFINLAFYSIFPIFLVQIIILCFTILVRKDDAFYNIPSTKLELQNKNKCFCFLFRKRKNLKKKKSQNFSEFVPEVNGDEPGLNSSNNETVKHMIIKVNNENSDSQKQLKIEENHKKNIESEQNLYTVTNLLNNIHDELKQQEIIESKATADFYHYKNNKNEKKENEINENDKNEKNEKDNKIENIINNEKEKEKELNDEKEYSIEDNYSFGMTVGKIIKFDKNINSKRNNQKAEDTLKRTQFIFNSFNSELNDVNKFNKNNSTNNFIPPYLSKVKKEEEKIIYSREEYFYFGYLLARIEDKRNITQIYLDLLEQCQIIFKFFFIPFNIYEDFKLQLIYYSIKLELYFLFNCLFIKSYVINNIYDDKHFFKDDLFRSIKVSFYTYLIGLFIYNLTNIKRTLIKRRNKILNLRISEQRLYLEIFKTTYVLCMDFLFNKLILLSILLVFIFTFSFYICFSFCAVNKYTQIYVLKGVVLSIIISQISPFIFCWIPSFLRKSSITLKDEIMYKFAKVIERFFIP